MEYRRPHRRLPSRRALAVLATLALVWAAVVVLRGGFYFHVGPVIVSSRRTTPALLLAVVSLGGILALTLARGRASVESEWRQSSAWLAASARTAAALAERYAMLVPLALLLVVAVHTAGRWATPRPLWLDEESTLINVRDRSFTELPGTLWLGQSAPLGWMAIERAVMLTAGQGDRALRLMPVLLGFGLCALAYLIGRRWLNVVGATVLVWCCAFGQWVVHNRFEAKPYSADAFTALLLTALTVWALEGDTPRDRRRRTIVWWLTAAVALWLANGAILTAPGFVLILVGVTWKRDGLRAAVVTAAWGGLWLVSFALCYWFSLRYTLGSTYLYEYWGYIHAFPQKDATVVDRIRWLGSRFKDLADNPGGTPRWLLLWLSALAGVLTSRRRVLALMAAAPPLTAFLLGMTHVVPLLDRVAFWMVPSVYLAVALLADRAGAWLAGIRRRQWLPVAVALALLVPVGALCQDLYRLRDQNAPPTGTRPLNHNLDDRQAVAYLLGNRRAGDAVLTTHLNWSPIWWYGGISLLNGPAVEGHFPDGGAQLEAGFDLSGFACRHDGALQNWMGHVPRLLVYSGFPDQSIWFGPALESELKVLGTVRDMQQFGEGYVLIVDPRPAAEHPPSLDGYPCISVGPATRW